MKIWILDRNMNCRICNKTAIKNQTKSLSQSAPTTYFCFENMGRFVTLKKNQDQNMDQKKVGSKKQGHCYPKKKRPGCLFSFWDNIDPVFWHPAFCNLFFGPFFKFQNLKNIRSAWYSRIVGADWLGDYVLNIHYQGLFDFQEVRA